MGFMTRAPCLMEYNVDCTANKSDVVLTGRNLERGTCNPTAEVKNLTAAPAAVCK